MAVKTEVTLIDGTVITLAGGSDQDFFLDHDQEIHGTPPASNTRRTTQYTTKVQGVFTETGLITESEKDEETDEVTVTTLGYSTERATPSLSGYDEDGRLVYIASTQIRSISLVDLPYEAPEVEDTVEDADEDTVEDAADDADDVEQDEDDEEEDEAPKAKKGKKAKKK